MMETITRRELRRRWVTANAVGELVGLGATFAVGFAVFTGIVLPAEGSGAALLAGAIIASTGLIEGTLVGLMQWWAMREAFPAIRAVTWWAATVVGSLAAWVLGSLPSTVIGAMPEAEMTAAQEPALLVVLLLAAAMGALLGSILALPQWWVLRRQVERAGRWIPANSLAWAVGMPLIFAGIDIAQRTSRAALGVLLMAVVLALTGAVVGTVHGAVLVRMAEGEAPASPLA